MGARKLDRDEIIGKDWEWVVIVDNNFSHDFLHSPPSVYMNIYYYCMEK